MTPLAHGVGQRQTKEREQTVHDYLFDGLGRMTADEITAGTGIDGTVDKIVYEDEVRGMLPRITSKNARDAAANRAASDLHTCIRRIAAAVG